MANCKREKSDSVTHLVKIVAKEVCQEELKAVYHRLGKLEIEEHAKRISRSFAKTHTTWHPFEQDRFEEEVSRFVDETACRHERSSRAIYKRLKQLFEQGFDIR